ncbi:hypothetical protein B0H19DRAFT_1080098 [Mycena capillaripes]|nr:hypothetical protein B0H19DRAFT_1080098 [Mycena capillaripes]
MTIPEGISKPESHPLDFHRCGPFEPGLDYAILYFVDYTFLGYRHYTGTALQYSYASEVYCCQQGVNLNGELIHDLWDDAVVPYSSDGQDGLSAMFMPVEKEQSRHRCCSSTGIDKAFQPPRVWYFWRRYGACSAGNNETGQNLHGDLDRPQDRKLFENRGAINQLIGDGF